MLKEISDGQESRKEWMLRQFKSAIIKHKRNTEFQFWTHDNHAEYLFSEKFIEQKLRYIHNNPVKAGIVLKAEDYNYSSTRDDGDEEGLIPIVKLFRRWKTYQCQARTPEVLGLSETLSQRENLNYAAKLTKLINVNFS